MLLFEKGCKSEAIVVFVSLSFLVDIMVNKLE